MTDLEKELIRLLVNLIEDIDDYEISFYKDLGISYTGESKLTKLIEKSIKPLSKYLDRKNDFTEFNLNDIFIEYLHSKNHTYKDVIELFQGLEDKNYD